MFYGWTNSERQQGKKEGVDLQGVGMEEHIQASGGASGPSQTQVVASNTPTTVVVPPGQWNGIKLSTVALRLRLLPSGEQGGWGKQCAQPVQHPWHPTLHPTWMGQVWINPYGFSDLWPNFTLLSIFQSWAMRKVDLAVQIWDGAITVGSGEGWASS